MRILVWQELFWPYIGGIEVLATKLFGYLLRRGHEFVVITRQDDLHLPSEEQYHGIRIHRYPFWRALDKNIGELMEVRSQIAKIRRSFRPDLVHVNAFGSGMFFYFATANAHVSPLLITLHTIHSRSASFPVSQDSLFCRTLRSANWVTGVSEAV